MEDTDSMAIVATEHGGPVPYPGGLVRIEDGREAVKALSLTQVDLIAKRFTDFILEIAKGVQLWRSLSPSGDSICPVSA